MPTITRYFISCHGCGTQTIGAGHDNQFEARVAAYSAGWRFPARIKADGEASKETDDVCPTCITDWKARPAVSRWANRR
ncbi:hypothetical protein [Streptomyces sp. NPDC057854]|uniref:hypothetical protein n=1 Tax=unclassified Streptomyces TaxID=2593676 RepID=UPI0036D1451A